MRKLAIVRDGDVVPANEYPVAVGVSGLRRCKLMSPRDYSLWLCVAELDAGAEISWPITHGDEAVYVFEGELDVAGHRCAAGGAVIIESNVVTTVNAITRTRVGHYGTWDPQLPEEGPHGPPNRDHHGVHVVGPRGVTAFGEASLLAVRFLANSTCQTCRLSLFEVARDTARRGRAHSHSADEIIYIVEGSMHLGAHELDPGTSLCIPAGVRYSEASGERGCVFLNYRPHASDRTEFVKGEPPVSRLEGSQPARDLRLENDVVNLEFR